MATANRNAETADWLRSVKLFRKFSGDECSILEATMTHRSINVAAIGPQGAMEGGSRTPMRAPFPSRAFSVGDHDLGHGGQNTIYDQTGARPYMDTWQSIPEVDEYFRKTAEAKQKKYAGQHLPPGGHGGGHFCIFPNVIIDHWRLLSWHPHGVGATESWRMYPVDKNAPKVVRDALRRYAMRYCGPAGMTESDIFRAVTLRPAQVLGLETEAGGLRPGAPADLTLLAFRDDAAALEDVHGEVRPGGCWEAVLTIRNGETILPDGVSC